MPTEPKPERLTEIQKAELLYALQGTELHGLVRNHFFAEETVTCGCEMNAAHLNNKCEQHPDPYDCEGVLVGPPFQKQWGLPVRDGTHSYIRIEFCPFCGKKLPT